MKIIYFIILVFLFFGNNADAAVRGQNTVTRTAPQTSNRQSSETKNKIVSRSVTPAKTTARSAKNTQRNIVRRNNTVTRTQNTTTARLLTPQTRTATNHTARATILQIPEKSNTFDSVYNECREAYFTCMDQFCATANDSYRRCICSSKLSEIQSHERALEDANEQLTDFKNFNLNAIDKSSTDISAMLTKTIGEQTQNNYQSTTAFGNQYSGLSDILTTTKNKSLSTQGQIDIAGDINAIWATTILTDGKNIANLTGEALYNAVHAQCSELVFSKCLSTTTLNMVANAYGMYIENDCSILEKSLGKQKNSTDNAIRASEHAMHLARLENYNAHNSKSINDCVAQVRQDITADTACGSDYVHCLDITGLYLDKATGEPIYSPKFYQLAQMTSLSGDVLTNSTNRLLVSELNNLRKNAQRGLDTCRDISDEVWDEFMRQAIAEIYQGQQERIRQVKKECISVVNTCYDNQTMQLKDFSNSNSQILAGKRLELSEQICQETLTTCSNLYGGGSDGLPQLLIAMRNITDQKISNMCLTALTDYATNLCAVPGNDTVHKYPYACRVYSLGEKKYAKNPICNSLSSQSKINYTQKIPTSQDGYQCFDDRYYTKCKQNYFLLAGKCYECPNGEECDEGTTENDLRSSQCGTNYIGSIYQKIVKYASQVCSRQSENQSMTDTVFQDIDIVVNQISTAMSQELSNECTRQNGIWVNSRWIDKDSDTLHDTTGDWLHKDFYSSTAANTDWGYCGTQNKTMAIIKDAITDTSTDDLSPKDPDS